MEQQFQLKTSVYVERLRTLGIYFMLIWGLTHAGLNMTWNLRAFGGIDSASTERLVLLYSMLTLYLILSWHILDMILLRSKRVLSLEASKQKYKLTFMMNELHIHLPCLEESVFIPYKEIKYWGIQEDNVDNSLTFIVETRGSFLSNNRVSVYFGAEIKEALQTACNKYAPDIKMKNKKEHLASKLLTVLEVTEASKVKTEVKQRSKV